MRFLHKNEIHSSLLDFPVKSFIIDCIHVSLTDGFIVNPITFVPNFTIRISLATLTVSHPSTPLAMITTTILPCTCAFAIIFSCCCRYDKRMAKRRRNVKETFRWNSSDDNNDDDGDDENKENCNTRTVFPHPFILSSIGKNIYSFALTLTIHKVPLVYSSIWPYKFPFTMAFVLRKLPIVPVN